MGTKVKNSGETTGRNPSTRFWQNDMGVVCFSFATISSVRDYSSPKFVSLNSGTLTRPVKVPRPITAPFYGNPISVVNSLVDVATLLQSAFLDLLFFQNDKGYQQEHFLLGLNMQKLLHWNVLADSLETCMLAGMLPYAQLKNITGLRFKRS